MTMLFQRTQTILLLFLVVYCYQRNSLLLPVECLLLKARSQPLRVVPAKHMTPASRFLVDHPTDPPRIAKRNMSFMRPFVSRLHESAGNDKNEEGKGVSNQQEDANDPNMLGTPLPAPDNKMVLVSTSSTVSTASTPTTALPTEAEGASLDTTSISSTRMLSSSSWSSSSWLITVVLPLWVVYVSNQWSRYSLTYLVDFSSQATPYQAMNVDIGFDQAQYGILASLSFTLLYAVATLFAGIASDRYNRKLLTVVTCMLWSIATIGTALAHTYTEVTIWRIFMGLACAFSTPTAYTLIRDRAPSQQLAFATSLYGTGVALASGLASLTILLDNTIGWRNSLSLIAALGATASILANLVVEDDVKPNPTVVTTTSNQTTSTNVATPRREVGAASSMLTDMKEALSIGRVQWIYIASFCRFCGGICIGVWGAPFFRLTYPDNQSEFSILLALISAVLATTSGVSGGALADWLVRNAPPNDPDPIKRRLWVPIVGSALAAPAWYWAVQTTDTTFELAMLWLALEYLIAECWFGPTISTLQSTVGPRIGGTAQGLFGLTGALANTAPSLLGLLYNQQKLIATTTAGSLELSTLLASFVCGAYLLSSICFAVAANTPPPSSSSPMLKKVM